MSTYFISLFSRLRGNYSSGSQFLSDEQYLERFSELFSLLFRFPQIHNFRSGNYSLMNSHVVELEKKKVGSSGKAWVVLFFHLSIRGRKSKTCLYCKQYSSMSHISLLNFPLQFISRSGRFIQTEIKKYYAHDATDMDMMWCAVYIYIWYVYIWYTCIWYVAWI